MTDRDETEVIFRPYITLKNGQRLYAWQVGKRAFPIRIRKSSSR
jgi:hypothetical protein